MAEQLQNNARNSSPSTITSVATTITVNDGSVFPASGDFRVVLESDSTYEAVVCTSRASDVLTVTRAQEGTSAVEHPSGTIVTHTVTDEGIFQYIKADVPVFRDGLTAAHLRSFNGDKLQSSDFGWVNQNTATRSDNTDGSISLFAPENVGPNQLRILTKDAPSAGNKPWKLTAAIIPTLHNYNDTTTLTLCHTGIGLRDQSSGRLWLISHGFATRGAPGTINDRHMVGDYSGPSNNFVTNFADINFPRGTDVQYLQIEHQADDVVFRSSADGVYWRTLTTQDATAAGRTFNQLVFFANAGNSTTNADQFDTYGTLISWSEENA